MRKYLSLIKFSHSIFAMPFALIGFFLATELYGFDWVILIYIILCMIFSTKLLIMMDTAVRGLVLAATRGGHCMSCLGWPPVVLCSSLQRASQSQP